MQGNSPNFMHITKRRGNKTQGQKVMIEDVRFWALKPKPVSRGLVGPAQPDLTLRSYLPKEIVFEHKFVKLNKFLRTDVFLWEPQVHGDHDRGSEVFSLGKSFVHLIVNPRSLILCV